MYEVDHDVFVVHADDDTPFVKGELLPMLGLPDERVILSSELPFPAFTEQAIEDAVRRSRLTIAVLSPAYLRDRWAGFAELLSRNANPDSADGGTLVPLLVADCKIPPILAQHEALDCRTLQQREASAARLRRRLDRPEPQIAPLSCPYPGMRPFSVETASRFHGRTRETEELLGRLQAGEREIYVIGPSGSGKSSLVSAGLIPRLLGAHGGLGGHRFAVRTLRPGEHPTQRLAEALGCETTRLEVAVGQLIDREACDRLLVFVDQLEELFAVASAQERDEFVRALRVLRADRRCHLIAALRVEFYGAVMSSELWLDIDGRFTRLEVAPLRGPALREAIEAPAREAGVYLERGLIERLMSDAATEPGALPLLQEALVLLWQRCRHRLLHLASYDDLGRDGRSGLAVALARRADAVVHGFTPSQQVLVRRIFLRLVSFGEGRPDTRRQQPRAALATSGEPAADLDEVLRRLVDERMLTSDAAVGGEPLVDLSHEALIAGWPKFQRWLLERRDDEQRRRRLELHAAEWVNRGRSSVGLFDPVELAEAERWIAGETARELGYSDDLPRFLTASRKAIEEVEHQKQRALEQQERERHAAREAIEKIERQKQRALEQQERERRAAQEERTRLRRRLTRFALIALTLFSIVASVLGAIAWRERRATRLQLGRNEQEQARTLITERHYPMDAIPHLVQAVNQGVDSAVLRTLLTEARRGTWRIAVRHGGPVQTATFSPDGTRVLTASNDGTARIWNAATGAPVGVPLKHEHAVHSAAFSPDGTRVVTTSDDGMARIWDAATGAAISVRLKHEKTVKAAAFSPDGTRVVTTGDDGTARVWNSTTGDRVGVPLKHEQAVRSAAFSPDGAHVVTASDDGTARIWNATTGAPVGVPLKHEGSVSSAAFSPDGTRLVTMRDDGTARVWDAATGAPVGVPLEPEPTSSYGGVRSAAFSPDGTRVVTAANRTARVWDAATGAPMSAPLRHEQSVLSAAFSPDGMRVVTANDDGTARVWNAATGAPVGVPLKHDHAVHSAAFSPDGTRVVTASDDGTARVWDTTTGTLMDIPLDHDHDKRVRSAAFNPDGTRVVTASDDGTARIWEAATGALVGVPLHHEKGVRRAAFSPDGTRVVTASDDKTARIWNAATSTQVGVPLKHDDIVLSAAFSPDGTRIVTASNDGTVRIWSAVTGTPVGFPLKHEETVHVAAFSPDSTRVVTASNDGTARIWNASTGAPMSVPLKHEQPVLSAAFSPDGTRVVTASLDTTARIWNASTGAPMSIPLKHEQPVLSAAFSPDGTHVVTASQDGTARIWNVVTGHQVGVPFNHEKWVWSAAFSPDGTRVVTASSEGTAQILDAATGTPVSVPLKHEAAIVSAAFSPDGTRVVTASSNGTAHVWTVAEPGALSIWVEQAMRCVPPGFDAVGTSAVCPLSADQEPTRSELLAAVRSLITAGDAAMFSHVWSVPRAGYRQAIALLDPRRGAVSRANEHDTEDLHRMASIRMAMLDALEDHLTNAHTYLGSNGPKTDALLLDQLGGLAHERLKNDFVALALLRRAHDLNPQHAETLARLAEAHFATWQLQDFSRAAVMFNKLQASPDERVAVAALTWAAARLTRTPEGLNGAHLLSVYTEITSNSHIAWSWEGTKHALTYRHTPSDEVTAILNALRLLEEPVTTETRAQLATLCMPPQRRAEVR